MSPSYDDYSEELRHGSLTVCSTCGALVPAWQQYKHDEWHADQPPHPEYDGD